MGVLRLANVLRKIARKPGVWSVLLVGLAGLACDLPQRFAAATPTPASPTPTETFTMVPTFTVTLIPTVTATPTETPVPVPTITPLPLISSLFTPTPSPEIPATATPTATSFLPEAVLSSYVTKMCPRPEACFMDPLLDSVVSGSVEFRGGASRPGFDYYKLELQAEGSSEWMLLHLGERPVRLGTLGFWQTTNMPSGTYFVRLRVVDIHGNYWAEQPVLRLFVQNAATAQPPDAFEGLRYNPTPTPEENN